MEGFTLVERQRGEVMLSSLSSAGGRRRLNRFIRTRVSQLVHDHCKNMMLRLAHLPDNDIISVLIAPLDQDEMLSQ